MVSKARLKYLRSLRQKKVREQEGVILVEGANVVCEALASGLVEEVYLTEEMRAKMPDVDAESPDYLAGTLALLVMQIRASQRVTCEACMTYLGRSICREASFPRMA